MADYTIKSGAGANKDGTLKNDQESTWQIARDAANATNTGFFNGGGMQIGSDDWPCIYRAFLWFDTSVVGSAQNITEAKLYLKAYTLPADKDFDIVIQKGIAENGNPVVHHSPCVAGDYNRTLVAGDGGSINTSNLIVDTFVCFTLNSAGRNFIKKGAGAITKFCLRSKDDIDNIPPENFYEFVEIYNGNTETENLKPYLEITIGPAINVTGKASITTKVEAYIYPIIENVKATKSAGHLKLYGEIMDLRGKTITERGFEYKIQDEEPGIEDTGTEVKETGPGFGVGEYNLSSWDTFNDLYCAEENKIWWFRAYCKDDQENKFIADLWMKNVPSTTTFECTEVGAQQAKGNGELIDLGANEVTKRGFRIIKEYSGDMWGANKYRTDGFTSELERITTYNENGIINGFIWQGILYRDSLHEDSGGYELEVYEKILGGGFLGEGFGIYLKSNDNLKVVAIAENELGMGFGGEVDLNTGQLILPSDDEIVSEVSAEKTITLGTIPGGATVIRIGIRLGRTMGCNEIHVYEDGSWGTGGSVTFFITDFVPGDSYYKMPYIIIDYGDHKEEILAIPDYRNPERLEEWLGDYPIEVFPEVEEEDEDELDNTIVDSSVGDISYRTIIKEIKCEKIGDQSLIDRYGRRRSQTVNNHLIQSRNNCKIIIDDYIEKFQILKLKIVIDYDIPIPFEREDVILLGDGKEKYREDGQGLISFKADGEGIILQQEFILTKIRKIDGRYESGKETILGLELEV